MDLEAQACGTFVVTFDSGGTCETLIYEETGICLRNGSVKSIIEVMRSRKISQGDSSMKEVNAWEYNGKIMSKESFDLKYINLYEDIQSVFLE